MGELFNLSNRSIWIFGGAGYLGSAVTTLLAEMGAQVLCVDIADKARTFVAAHDLSDRVKPISLDTTNLAAVSSFVTAEIEESGCPHGFINLTFSSTGKAFTELTTEEFDQVNHDGITAVFHVCRLVGQAMAAENRGSMVLFSSMYGSVVPYPSVYRPPMNKNPIEYGVGKAAISQMAKYMAVQWADRRVRCNCVAPGPFPNPHVQQQHPDFIARLKDKVPMQRIGKPDEIAGVVAFLLADASSYMTGQTLAIDGGWTCW